MILQKMMMHDSGIAIRRLFSGLSIYTNNEDKLTSGMDEFTKSYLVNRRTILLISLVIRIFDLVIGLTAFGVVIEEITQFAMNKFTIMVVAIEFSHLILNTATLVMCYKMYTRWHQFILSIYYSRILAAIIIIVPVMIASIPIYNEIHLHHEEGTDNPHEDYSFDIAIIQTISSVIPVITNAQNFITASNVLIADLKETYELKFIRSISMLIYIPIYLTAIMVLFNITVDYLVLIIGLLYILYIISPLLSSLRPGLQSHIRALQWLWLVVMFVLAIVIISHIVGGNFSTLIFLSIVSAIIGSYINYILMSVVMIDLVCYFVIRYRAETADTTDSFDILINNVAEPADDGYKKISQK